MDRLFCAKDLNVKVSNFSNRKKETDTELFNLTVFLKMGRHRGMTCDFQQCGILTSVDSYEPVQHHFKLRNAK